MLNSVLQKFRKMPNEKKKSIAIILSISLTLIVAVVLTIISFYLKSLK
jgi:flagellar basal body-associated protein FliL